MKNDRPGIYIHIPFCLRKCPYCDFVSYPLQRDETDRIYQYICALTKEAALRKRWLEAADLMPEAFHSLYIGGGTPSLLKSSQVSWAIEEIAGSFPLAPGAEVTLEVNPGTSSREELYAWRRLGINRLSIGAQSLNDEFLKKLGRVHTARDVYQTVEWARSAGFSNISFDLMLGLPGQRLEDWQRTVVQAVEELKPQHLSCYELTIEEGTLFGRLKSQGSLNLPPEDEVVAMLEWTREHLTNSGYEHYEISNYALPGFRSRHNQIYWENRWYLGLGAAACSYWAGRRWGNAAGLDEYMQQLDAGSLPEAYSERLDERSQLGETIMLGLRLTEGVSTAELEARFGLSIWDIWEEEITDLQKAGLLEVSGERLRLTQKGLLLANQVQAAFL